MKDRIVEAVRADLLLRSQLGLQKYGTSLERTDLDMQAWLQHAYEEALDFANYLKRSIMELNGTLPTEEEIEQDRSDAIAIEICDAVLQWFVDKELCDDGEELSAGDVLEILDALLIEEIDDPETRKKAAEEVLRSLKPFEGIV